MRIHYQLRCMIEDGARVFELEPLIFELLAGIRSGGNLRHAAASAGVSYRHAWGLMHRWEARLGRPLVTLQRGRGAQLSAAGIALLEAHANAGEQTGAALLRAEQLASERLSGSFGGALVRFLSSHSDLVNRLREHLTRAGRHVEMELVGSAAALRGYHRGDADVAGFHAPLGALGATVGRALIRRLDDARDRIHLLERRELGLMSRPEARCRRLDALTDARWRFINRQGGSGTRLIFDALLETAGLQPGQVNGYGDEEYTHSAVAALVASGGADAGFGTRTAAAKMALHFEPMVQEHFYVVVRRDADTALLQQVDVFCAQLRKAADASTPTPLDHPDTRTLAALHG